MPSVLNEHTQFTDVGGKPLVNGKVYFGVQNADPVVSPITIYSDRALTTVISSTQTLDANGRTTNKVWIGARYSIRVDTSADVQVYQELDNGEADDIGVTALENVAGANTITATAATTITAYVDKEIYTFRTASANTDVVILNIDSVGGKPVLKNHDQQLVPDDFEANQNVMVQRNETDDIFEWLNQNAKTVMFSEGTAVVAAATTDIWDLSGNTVHITGNTGITSLGTAPNAGAIRWVIFDGTPILTHSANLNLPGGVNFPAAAGDVARVYADTTTQLDVQIYFGAATQAQQEAGTSVRDFVSPGTQQFHASAAKATAEFDGTATDAGADLDGVNDSYNLSSIVKNSTGDNTLNFTIAFSSVNFTYTGGVISSAGATSRMVGQHSSVARTASAFRCQTTTGSSATLTDLTSVSLSFFGDQ